jgi:DNA-3-methyladenine glycosylase II
MAELVRKHGAMRIEPRTAYVAVVRAVVGQQLSVKAASTIFGRLTGGEPPSPTRIIAASDDELRSCGLSRPKVRYLKAISDASLVGSLDNLDQLHDEQVVSRLSALPGVGRWTAEMVMIFALGRDDVWPAEDAGLSRAARTLFRVESREEFTALGERFRPWRSHAAWYLWRSLDGK